MVFVINNHDKFSTNWNMYSFNTRNKNNLRIMSSLIVNIGIEYSGLSNFNKVHDNNQMTSEVNLRISKQSLLK